MKRECEEGESNPVKRAAMDDDARATAANRTEHAFSRGASGGGSATGVAEPVTPGGIVRGDVYAGAEFSPCERYRFRLWRDLRDPLDFVWTREKPLGSHCVFVMLNPSTATEDEDDPTIRRCISFTRTRRHDVLVVVNLFALRSTDPDALLDAEHPMGFENQRAIAEVLPMSSMIVCAWGAHPATRLVTPMIDELRRDWRVHHLGLTKDGHPRHPLYLRGDVQPIAWSTP